MSVFSIPAFFIVLREVLEACLVVGIALAYFNRTGNTQYNKWVWSGAVAGILVSLGFGIAFAVVFYKNGNQIFSDNAEKIFEGIMFLVAAGLLTWMIIWMMHMGKELRGRMERHLDDIIEDDKRSPPRRKAAVFTMVFVQVLREGIETFIFVFGSQSADEVGGWRAIPIPGILAIVIGVLISFLVFKGLVNLDIQRFFDYSSFVLIAFAAGLVSHAFHELQEVNWFGPWEPSEKRDWYNYAMWSTKRCCNDSDNQFFAMLRALFGYQDTPTFVEWVTYFAYWLIVIGVYLTINWKRIRAERDFALLRAQQMIAWAALFMFVGFVYAVINPHWIGVLCMTLGLVLAVATTPFVYEPLLRAFRPLRPLRRRALSVLGMAWGLLTALMLALHLAELICEGRGEGTCGLKRFEVDPATCTEGDECPPGRLFFFFGLVLDPSFNAMGRTQGDVAGMEKEWWPAIAVLSISFILTLFFFGGLTFRLLLAAANVGADGLYMGDDYVMAKGEAEGDADYAKDELQKDGSPIAAVKTQSDSDELPHIPSTKAPHIV